MSKTNSAIFDKLGFSFLASVFLTVLYVLWLLGGYWGLGFTVINSLLLLFLLFNPRMSQSKESLFYIVLSFILSLFLAIRSFEFGHYATILMVFLLDCLAVSRSSAKREYPLTLKTTVAAPLLILINSFVENYNWIKWGMEWITQRKRTKRSLSSGSADFGVIIRGGIIAVPLVLLFGILFISADPLFAHYVQQFFGNIQISLTIPNPWDIAHTIFIFGLFSALLRAKPIDLSEFSFLEMLAKYKSEVGIAVAIVAILFALFLSVQGQYLFATEQFLKDLGIMYSEYTRRGYTELLAISAISLLLVSILLKGGGLERSANLKVTVLVFIFEVFLLLISATRRTYLYQESFGLTQARVLGFFASIWLTTVLGLFFIRALNLLNKVSLVFAIFIASAVTLLLIHIANVDYLISAIKPPTLGYGTDYAYIAGLSSDAWPSYKEVIEYLETTNECRVFQEWQAILNLSEKQRVLEYQSKNNWNMGGAVTVSDLQALKFLQKNAGKINTIKAKFEECLINTTQPAVSI